MTTSLFPSPARLLAALALAASCLLPSACEKKSESSSSPSSPNGQQPELLLYCGITMIRPMTEICQIVEKEKNCKILITKGGSGELLNAIKVNKTGDLFLPGSENYISDAKTSGIVTDSVDVGANQAALLCPKGNPKQIPMTLASLADPKYYVVLSDPDSGAIGKESKKILDAANLWDPVIANTKKLTTDAKRLTQFLKDGVADLTINWCATASWEENAPFVDAYPIPSAPQNKLVLGILSSSKHPEIARTVMALSASDKGKAIFQKYGLSSGWPSTTK